MLLARLPPCLALWRKDETSIYPPTPRFSCVWLWRTPSTWAGLKSICRRDSHRKCYIVPPVELICQALSSVRLYLSKCLSGLFEKQTKFTKESICNPTLIGALSQLVQVKSLRASAVISGPSLRLIGCCKGILSQRHPG